MSLINQMLRDLEARSSEHDKQNHYAGVLPIQSVDESGMPWAVFLVLIFFATIVALFGIYHWQQRWVLTKQHSFMLARHQAEKAHELKLATLKAAHQPKEIIKTVKQVVHAPAMEKPVLAEKSSGTEKPRQRLSHQKQAHALMATLKKHKERLHLPKLSKSIKQKLTISQEQVQDYKKVLTHAVKQQHASDTQSHKPNHKAKTKKIAKASPTSYMIKTEVKRSPLEQADMLYENILPLIDKGMMTRALAQLQSLLNKYPEYRPGRIAIAELYLQANKAKEAIEQLDIGLKHTPQYAPYVEMKAQILMQQGKLNAALLALAGAQPKLEYHPDYYALMAGLNERLGKYSAAASLYKSLLDYNPDNSVWWIGLGLSYEGLGRNNAAIHAYNKAQSNHDLQPGLQGFVETRLNALGA